MCLCPPKNKSKVSPVLYTCLVVSSQPYMDNTHNFLAWNTEMVIRITKNAEWGGHSWMIEGGGGNYNTRYVPLNYMHSGTNQLRPCLYANFTALKWTYLFFNSDHGRQLFVLQGVAQNLYIFLAWKVGD